MATGNPTGRITKWGRTTVNYEMGSDHGERLIIKDVCYK